MKAPEYRKLLPLVMGGVAAVLIAWDIYNAEVAYEMGMAWDTGWPVVPYRLPEILLPGLNFPAYVLASPFLWLLDLKMQADRYPVLFVAIVAWWHLLGRRLDLGITPPSWTRFTRAGALLCIVIGIGTAYMALDAAAAGVQWWLKYSQGLMSDQTVLLFLYVGPAAWELIIASWFGRMAWKMLTRDSARA